MKIVRKVVLFLFVLTISSCGGGGDDGAISGSGDEVVTVGNSNICSNDCAAVSGACSSHGGDNCLAGPTQGGKVICNDGWRDSTVDYVCH